VTQERVEYRVHALQRMWQRSITPKEVSIVLTEGAVLEEYLTDTPYPSRLLFGVVNNRPLHIVAAYNDEEETIVVVTVYQPDLLNWKSGFRERRK